MFKTTLRPPGHEDLDDGHALSKLELTLEHTPASISWVTNLLSQQDFLLETSSHYQSSANPAVASQQAWGEMVSKGSFTRSAFTDSTKHMDLGLFCQQLDSLFTRDRQLLGTELLTKHALEQCIRKVFL